MIFIRKLRNIHIRNQFIIKNTKFQILGILQIYFQKEKNVLIHDVNLFVKTLLYKDVMKYFYIEKYHCFSIELI